MHKSRLVASIFGAGALAATYDKINGATGSEPKALLYIAIGLLVLGLYLEFRANNKTDARGES